MFCISKLCYKGLKYFVLVYLCSSFRVSVLKGIRISMFCNSRPYILENLSCLHCKDRGLLCLFISCASKFRIARIKDLINRIFGFSLCTSQGASSVMGASGFTTARENLLRPQMPQPCLGATHDFHMLRHEPGR